MANREPLTAKQKLLMVATLTCLNIPAVMWWWYWGFYLDYFSRGLAPPHFLAVGTLNLIVGVSLLALITEKWIRKIK
jgi:hypothetical protein